jgi:hypothetical protein
VIFNSEVQGDIGNCFRLNSDEDDREVNSSETDRVDGVRISKRGRGDGDVLSLPVMRVNSANVLNEGLRIGEIGRRMNSKVKLVEIVVYRK